MDEQKLTKILQESQERMERLKNASPEELLEAAIHHYSSLTHGDHKLYPDCERWLRLGFALAQPGGWERIAPAWLECTNPVHEETQN